MILIRTHCFWLTLLFVVANASLALASENQDRPLRFFSPPFSFDPLVEREMERVSKLNQAEASAAFDRYMVAGKSGDDLAPGTLNSILKQSGLK